MEQRAAKRVLDIIVSGLGIIVSSPIMLIIAIISIAFGVLCIVNAFGMVKLAMQFVGAALIYDGISDLWVVTKTVRTVKEMEREAKAVDVDYKEID